MFRVLGVVSALSIALASASALSAATAIDFGAVDIGKSFTLTYNGETGAGVVSGLGAVANLRLTAITGNRWDFAWSLDNISTAPSRVSVFAFDVDAPAANPVFAGVPTGQLFDRTGSGVVASLGAREFCLRAGGGGSQCAGGGGGGIAQTGGFSADQQFSLVFQTAPALVRLANFGIRYQSVTGIKGVTSAVGVGSYEPLPGVVTGSVPEPASWAMMISGFALVGSAMRRRRLQPAG